MHTGRQGRHIYSSVLSIYYRTTHTMADDPVAGPSSSSSEYVISLISPRLFPLLSPSAGGERGSGRVGGLERDLLLFAAIFFKQ